MRVALITTVGINPGDEWIREGILHFLDRLGRLKLWLINKHDLSTLTGPDGDAIRNAELVVQCGTPFYFAVPKKALHKPYWSERTSATAGWIKPIWHDRIAKVWEDVPVLNIAAGSAQLHGSDGREVADDRACRRFITEAHRMCRLTTVRDSVARNILQRLKLEAPLLPCTSIFARDRLAIEPAEPDLVCLNYMPRAGLYLPQQKDQVERWKRVFLALFEHVRARYTVKVVCHAEHDVESIRGMVDDKYVFTSNSYEEVLRLYARCARGVFNRVHAGMVVASFGRPALVVGTDTRMGMMEQVGLPFRPVDDVTAESLIEEFESMEAPDIEPIRKRAAEAYREAIDAAI